MQPSLLYSTTLSWPSLHDFTSCPQQWSRASPFSLSLKRFSSQFPPSRFLTGFQQYTCTGKHLTQAQDQGVSLFFKILHRHGGKSSCKTALFKKQRRNFNPKPVVQKIHDFNTEVPRGSFKYHSSNPAYNHTGCSRCCRHWRSCWWPYPDCC